MPFIVLLGLSASALAYGVYGLLVLITFTALTGVAAHARGRDVVAWVLLTLVLIGPIALLFVLVMRPLERGVEQRRMKSLELRRCPSCAELVRYEALKCRFCLADMPPVESTSKADVSAGAMRERREARSKLSWS